MIETLFGYNAADKRWNGTKKEAANDPSAYHIQILDPKKSQNLAISLRARNVKVEEVCDALMEGNGAYLCYLFECHPTLAWFEG